MTIKRLLQSGLLACMLLQTAVAAPRPAIDLAGYLSDSGAITILHTGDTTDPYFAMQALLLANDNGLDTSAAAEKFANWLVTRQKPDGTFDRFCQGADKNWVACKTADADDSLLALWMRLLLTIPAQLSKNPALSKSYAISQKALDHLFQPSRGIYMVSPVYLHGLFMDNLEVWSLQAHLKPVKAGVPDKLAQSIFETFWQPVNKHFLVSTQLEQRAQAPAFYPDHVAQIFPLLFDFPVLPQNAKPYYQNWMKLHRAEWLRQGEKDYPWGLLAVLAVRQGDVLSARCWLREASAMRHSRRGSVTDEAAYQVVTNKNIQPAKLDANCS